MVLLGADGTRVVVRSIGTAPKLEAFLEVNDTTVRIDGAYRRAGDQGAGPIVLGAARRAEHSYRTFLVAFDIFDTVV